MGTDKSLLAVDGVAQARRVADALSAAGAEPVRCVGGDAEALAALGLVHVVDLHPGEGPLGGIVTALSRAAPGSIVVVLAVDLLRPDPATIRRIVEVSVADDLDLAVPHVDGRGQWLHGAWRRDTALDHLATALAVGERAVHRAVAGLHIGRLADVSSEVVADADRPEDLTLPQGQK